MDRRLHSLIRVGTVSQVDTARVCARVSFGDALSDWLPWSQRAGVVREWAPLEVGEQVVVVSPGGDTAQGAIIGSLNMSTRGAGSDDAGAWRVAIGGSTITMTADAIELAAGGSTITLDAAGIRLSGVRIDLN